MVLKFSLGDIKMAFQNKYKNKEHYVEHPDHLWNEISEILEGLPELIISENKNAYFVRAMLAGLNVDDFLLRFKENKLELEIHLKSPSGRYLFQERAVGKFIRKVEFALAIDGTKIKSELSNGLLFLELPKIKTKTIEIIPGNIKNENLNAIELDNISKEDI